MIQAFILAQLKLDYRTEYTKKRGLSCAFGISCIIRKPLMEYSNPNTLAKHIRKLCLRLSSEDLLKLVFLLQTLARILESK